LTGCSGRQEASKAAPGTSLRLLLSLAGHAHLQLAADLVDRMRRLAADDCLL
jgi:hypothetical protein